MKESLKIAWLIGLYTGDLRTRMERLGYRLTRVFPDLSFIGKVDEVPDLIVFSEEGFNDINGMRKVKSMYPNTVIVSLPTTYIFMMDEDDFTKKVKSEHLIARLISSIQPGKDSADN